MLNKLKFADSALFKFVMIINVVWILLCTIGSFAFDESGDLVLLGIGVGLALAIISFVDYIIAGYFYFAGVDKEYKDVVYLRMSYFIPPVGYLLIIALPDHGNAQVQAQSNAIDELPEI